MDLLLETKYSTIPKEKRVLFFLQKIEKLYSLTESNDSLFEFVNSFDIFLKEVNDLEKIGFYKPVIDSISIHNVQKWRWNIISNYYKLETVNINKSKDSVFKDNNLWVSYYYNYNKSIKNDTITKKWIKSKICFSPKSSVIPFLKTLHLDYLNSDNAKLMMFTEFILPFYSPKERNFDIKNFMNTTQLEYYEIE